MPIYEYEAPDGSTVILHRPVDQRDDPVQQNGVAYRRRQVPSKFTIGIGAQPEPMGSKLRKGYYDLEQKQKLNQGGNYLPLKTVIKALDIPDVHDVPTPSLT